MSNAKEKAKELISKFQYNTLVFNQDYGWVRSIYDMKQCALICIDEMLDLRNNLYMNEGSLVHEYLLEVKKEIENYEIH